jgi:hypothetical protein
MGGVAEPIAIVGPRGLVTCQTAPQALVAAHKGMSRVCVKALWYPELTVYRKWTAGCKGGCPLLA